MFEIRILASSSSGNATLVRSESATILIDAGLSARQLTERLAQCHVSPKEISAILITHEHSDHVKGLPQWCKQHNTPVFCNRHTATILREKMNLHQAWHIFETGSSFSLNKLNVQPFSIPHDAVDPVGFVLREEKAAFGFATDLGYATQLVIDSLKNLNGLLLEANYDEQLLQQDSKRPWSVKQRIASRHGHLSNHAAATLLEQLLHEELQYVALGHLSADCNKEELALEAIDRVLNAASPLQRWCASPDQVSRAIVIE